MFACLAILALPRFTGRMRQLSCAAVVTAGLLAGARGGCPSCPGVLAMSSGAYATLGCTHRTPTVSRRGSLSTRRVPTFRGYASGTDGLAFQRRDDAPAGSPDLLR